MGEQPHYRIIIDPLSEEDGGGFLATVPDLPGCMSDGATEAEAVLNVQDAIACWLEAAGE
jgi:antitoxin HicB